ncbi:MAG: hypothetical protein CME61_01095 [Halobacteriovoraceae bacterium]|nr:hypothetical protein [Halobacteriovoraceae bacterium]|tara:strand:+ start:482 stop:808 length:327 start_codon:yes stop_codon:yes gene_type:complete
MGGKLNQEEKIMKTFREVYKNQTFQSLSLITGIQKTRLFRIINGAELKFKEFEVISSLVSEKLGRGYSDYFYKQLNFAPKVNNAFYDKMTREKMKSEMAQVYLIKNGV